MIFPNAMRSSNTSHDVIMPETGTKSDNGATEDAGYFFISEFQIQYPNIVVIYD